MNEARTNGRIACYHLPGLFEFYDLYRVFLPLYRTHRDWFYDWCDIGSIYGAPADCLWGGGRIGCGDADPRRVLELTEAFGISARLTFSNSLLTEKHLSDRKCNALCSLFAGSRIPSGIIIHSELLLSYLKNRYPSLYFVSSTTKVLTGLCELRRELCREEFRYTVADFRLNGILREPCILSEAEKKKAELLCNECCDIGCTDRKACYENVSRRVLGEDVPEHICRASDGRRGYRFSAAMESPAFIGTDDIRSVYLPSGFSQFKLEGRSLGSAVILELLLYYMTKPSCRLRVREEIYLDSNLDLF